MYHVCYLCFKIRKRAKIRNQYNQVPHLSQDTTRKSDKHTIRHHKQEPRGQPFPSRGPQGINKQTPAKINLCQVCIMLIPNFKAICPHIIKLHNIYSKYCISCGLECILSPPGLVLDCIYLIFGLCFTFLLAAIKYLFMQIYYYLHT